MNVHLRSWMAATLAAATLLSVADTANAASFAPTTRPAALPDGAVGKRYAAGVEAFEAERFEEAGQAWADVLDQIPETPRNRSVRAAVVVDAMSAYQEAYEAGGDSDHLQTALETYYRYFSVYEETYDSPNIPKEVVQARFALRGTIEQAQAARADAQAEGTTTSAGSSTSSSSATSTQDPAPAPSDPSSGGTVAISTSRGKQVDRSGTPLIAAGAAVLAVGVGASSMVAVGAVEGQRARDDSKTPGYTDEQRDAIDRRGRTMNAVFISGLVTTPILIGTGAALLGVGVRRHRRARLTAVMPKVRGNFVGLTIKGQF